VSQSRRTRTRDGRSWQLGVAEDVRWINAGTGEVAGNGIGINIPRLYEAYWTIDVPNSAEREPSDEQALQLDTAVIDIFAAHTEPQPWWLGFLARGPSSNLVFADAPQLTVINGGHVVIQAGPGQALAWRDEDGWLHGFLPDVIFPSDRSWLSVTNWDDYWMSVGGPALMLQSFLEHPLLRGYVHQVDYDDSDATPPGHHVWWQDNR
jgi:hypothetical protein